MPRVAGIDPGTVSFDLCVLQDGEAVVEQVFETGSLSSDSGPLLDALARHGPYDLIYGPSGYGLPLVAAADVGERELAEMVLVRPDESRAEAGVGGMRSLLRALASSGLPVVFGPGVIHLPSVPRHRKYNRIDMGTGDKVCAAACAIFDQSARRAVTVDETAMILLELGGAFTAAVAIDGGQIVDGIGGSSGPLGVRAAGALDGEVAYLLGPAIRKNTLYSGGALDPDGTLDITDLEAVWTSPRPRRRLVRAARSVGQGGARAHGQRPGAARDRGLGPPGPTARVDRDARLVTGGRRSGDRARSGTRERRRARWCTAGRRARRRSQRSARRGAKAARGRRQCA